MKIRIDDLVNGVQGYFVAAPALLTASPISDSLTKSADSLLQGVVSIILMFLTKWAFSKLKKKQELPPAPTPEEIEKQIENDLNIKE